MDLLTQFRDSAEVHQTLHDVLADPEFRHLTRSDGQRRLLDTYELPQWLKDFLEWLFDSEESATPSTSLPINDLLFYLAVGSRIMGSSGSAHQELQCRRITPLEESCPAG